MRAKEITRNAFRIPGQIGPRAANVLIWVQQNVASLIGPYRYLEIGSFRGRTLLPHVICDECEAALSIDLRSHTTPDERGPLVGFDAVTTEEMVSAIKTEAGGVDVDAKLRTITGGSDKLKTLAPDDRFDIAFIDGEHTLTCAFRDFMNALPVMHDDSVILFDDAPVIYEAIVNACVVLDHLDRPWKAIHTSSGVSAICLGLFSETLSLPPRVLATHEEMLSRRRAVLARVYGNPRSRTSVA